LSVVSACKPQDGATPFTPRTNKDRIEEALFQRRRDLFSDLEMVFFDSTSICFAAIRRARRARSFKPAVSPYRQCAD
jgi:hypothetical protein